MSDTRRVMFEWSPNGKIWFPVKLSSSTSRTSVEVISDSYQKMGYQVRKPQHVDSSSHKTYLNA